MTEFGSWVSSLVVSESLEGVTSTWPALSVAREWIVYWPSAGGVKLYDQLLVPEASFQVSLALLKPLPSQYLPELSCLIETSTLARPEAEPSLSWSAAVPQMLLAQPLAQPEAL